MIDLETLKEKWAEHDRKLDESLSLNGRILNSLNLGRARSALQRLAAIQAAGAITSLWCIVALGNFIFANRALPRYALPAIALDLLAIMCLIALVRQIYFGLQIDHGRPITAIQKQLEVLRRLRVRYVQAGLICGMLAWTPFVIVVLKGFFDVDAYRALGAGWLAGNIVFTVAVDAIAIWVARKYRGSAFILRFTRDAMGYNFSNAAGFVQDLSDFERD